MHANWLYLLRSNKEWGVVSLGTIEGLLEQAVAEMDELDPELAPYGISSAWRVADVDRAFGVASKVLGSAYIQDDFYEFQHLEEVRTMRNSITNALATDEQFLGFPGISQSWPTADPSTERDPEVGYGSLGGFNP